MKLIFGNLGLAGKSVLIILHEKDDSVTLSARNLLGVDIIKFEDLNTYNITSFDMLLITKESFAKLGDVKSS